MGLCESEKLLGVVIFRRSSYFHGIYVQEPHWVPMVKMPERSPHGPRRSRKAVILINYTPSILSNKGL